MAKFKDFPPHYQPFTPKDPFEGFITPNGLAVKNRMNHAWTAGVFGYDKHHDKPDGGVMDMVKDGWTRVAWLGSREGLAINVLNLKKSLASIQSALLPLFEKHGDSISVLIDDGRFDRTFRAPLGALVLGTESQIIAGRYDDVRENPQRSRLIQVGSCVDILDDDQGTAAIGCSDATEMAGLIEDSQPLSRLEFSKLGGTPGSKENEFGINKDVVWRYNPKTDIHHFYVLES